MNNVSSPSFKGIYKVTMPKVDDIKDEKEKKVFADAVIGTVVLGMNMSEAEPRIAKDDSAVFYKINDAKDKAFEEGFKNIINECNKQINTDIAKKVYYEKVSEQEYQNFI